MPPQKSEIKQLVAVVHSLKAAIFHTMAYKMSPEINKGNVTLPTRRSFLEVLYNVCQIKKKQITFEQYYQVHINGPKIAICEITSDTVFVLNSAFTTKDNYFQVTLDDAIDAFDTVLLDFGYTQQLQRYNPEIHQVHPPSKHPFWPKNYTSDNSNYPILFTSPHSDAVAFFMASLMSSLSTCIFHFLLLNLSTSPLLLLRRCYSSSLSLQTSSLRGPLCFLVR